jgi:hypothetical protein
MLFTDGACITISDLLAMEGELTIVADAQGITLQTTIDEACREVGQWVLGQIQSFGPGATDAVMSWHAAQSSPMYSTGDNRPRFSLSQIVTTDAELTAFRTDLAQLCLYEALRQFYRNASRMADTDRYEEKRDEYAREIKQTYRPRFLRAGLPIVSRPLPRPAAQWEPASGSFALSDVTSNGTETIAARSVDIALTYVDSGVPTNNESAPSARVTVPVVEDTVPVVSIARLRPPTGGTKPAQLPRVLVSQLQATHWNVYAGAVGGTLYLQNAQPISIETQTYELPALLETATPAGVGQYAERYVSLPDVIFRG